MDAIAEFCAIVDCDPSEVLDIPADRVGVESTYVKPEHAIAARGTITLPFGKHKGKMLSEIPRHYLQWLVRQPPLVDALSATRRGVEKTKNKVRDYLRTSE